MDLFSFTRNHLSPIEHKSSVPSHRDNRRQSRHFISFKTIITSTEEIALDAISREMIKKSAYQAKGKEYQFKEREHFIGKIRRVVSKLSFLPSTYFFSIFLMDIIKEKAKKIGSEDIAIGSLIIAMKFNENFNDICSLHSIHSAFEAKAAHSSDRLREIEMMCLKCIDHDLSIISPYIALEHLILREIAFSSDFPNESIKQIKAKLDNEARELMDKITRKTHMYIKFNSFVFALSIVCCVRESNYLPIWNEVFTFLYSMSLKDITECYLFIVGVIPLSTTVNGINSLSAITSCANSEPISSFKKIKVNVSSSLNELRLLSPSRYQKTIDSYCWKSQRSTSASLDETPLTTRNPIRTNCSHQNFNINHSRSKSSNRKQANLIYKPIRKYLSSNMGSLTSKTIRTEPTLSQSIQKQINNYNRNKQIQTKIIKAFKKNSVLILQPILGKSGATGQTHRSDDVQTKSGGNTKENSINSSSDLKALITERMNLKWNSLKKKSTQPLNSKEKMNNSSKPHSKAYQMLTKSNQLRPYVTLTNLGVKIHKSTIINYK